MTGSLLDRMVFRTQISLSGISLPPGAPTSIADLAGRIIDQVLPLITIALVGIIIYGGYMYMTSFADPARVKAAIGIITNGIIGAAIVALAFVIRTIARTAVGF